MPIIALNFCLWCVQHHFSLLGISKFLEVIYDTLYALILSSSPGAGQADDFKLWLIQTVPTFGCKMPMSGYGSFSVPVLPSHRFTGINMKWAVKHTYRVHVAEEHNTQDGNIWRNGLTRCLAGPSDIGEGLSTHFHRITRDLIPRVVAFYDANNFSLSWFTSARQQVLCTSMFSTSFQWVFGYLSIRLTWTARI